MLFKVHYIAHSGWLVEMEQNFLLFDYWQGELPAVLSESSKPLLILVSHSHPDHFNRQVFSLAAERPGTKLILAEDIPAPPSAALILREGDSANIGSLKLRAYGSTDAGISFIVELPGATVFHAGDYNLWHWPLESTSEEITEAENAFYAILKTLAIESVDIAFFPVDSRQQQDYDRGAREFCSSLRPSVLFPMHFGEGRHTIEPFRTWAEEHLPDMRVLVPAVRGECFTLEL